MKKSGVTICRGLGLIFIAGCGGKAVPIGWSPIAAAASGGSASDSGGAPAGSSGMPSASGGLEPSASGGLEPSGGADSVPLPVAAGDCARQLASGDSHLCILYADGRVWCMGANDLGQLGNGTFSDSRTLSRVSLPPVARIAAGGDHTCALTTSGKVYCWGDNRASELGVTGISQSATPVQVVSDTPPGGAIVQLVLGQHHSCFLNAQVHGVCWGTDTSSGRVLPVPTQLAQIGLRGFQTLAAGASRTRVIDSDILSDASWDPSTPLIRVAGLDDGVIDNAISPVHDCVLKRSGTVWCRGAGYPSFYAFAAEFGNDVAELKVGEGFSCARTSDGKVSCAGYNGWGQLGGGTLANAQGSVQGVRAVELGPALELSLGRAHSCARLADGSVWCWGLLQAPASLAQNADATPGVRSTPEKLDPPDPAETCGDSDGLVAARPWGPAPAARPIDELNDAIVAWGQNQCRCDSNDEPTIVGCVGAETPVLNGCLQALAANQQPFFASCEAPKFWAEASCAASCFGMGLPGSVANCAGPSDCGPTWGATSFCLRRSLACAGDGSSSANARATCDGIPDCANGFDEANCTPNQAQFHCADGTQIAIELLEDGKPDCADGSDEWLPG